MARRFPMSRLLAAAGLLLTLGCGAEHGQVSGSGNAGANGGLITGGSGARAGGAGGAAGSFFPDQLKPNGMPGTAMQENCDPNLTGLIRDFTPDHPDFEAYSGNGASKGIVKAMLGPDQKPVYAGTGIFKDPKNGDQVTSPDSFQSWYRNTPGKNMAIEYRFMLTPGPNGVSSFDSDAFFPIDGKGFGNFEDTGHNFHFTTELHTTFAYGGGETFNFKGDDDLWVFINNRLAIDLGGLHPRVDASVALDTIAAEFGLEKGKTYNLDLFHAERHTNQSNFRVDTTIKFTNCNPLIVP